MSHLVTLPALQIRLDGTLLEQHSLDTFESLRVQQHLSLPVLVELVFLNPPESLLEKTPGSTGQSLEVNIEGQARSLFKGDVTAVEVKYRADQSCRLYLRGHDRLHRMGKRRPVRAHIQLTLVDLARELTGDLDVEVEAEDSGVIRQTLVQHCQSDLQLLREVAEREGIYFQLCENRLRFFALNGLDETITLVLGHELISAEAEINNDASCHGVETKAWDPWMMEMREGSASHARSGRRTSLQSTAEDTQVMLTNRVAQSNEQAEALAQGLLDRRAAAQVVLRGIAEGDSHLQPGVGIEVQGIQHSLAGRYVLASVVHIVDRQQGYVCELDSTPPPQESGDNASTSTFGLVSRVDDPQGLARIRVILPAFYDFETDWLDVVMPAAGPGKGLIALPDIDDRVLLLLVNGDPAQAVVLGGVYGSQPPPDAGVEGDKVERYSFLTPGGQSIRMDDGTSSIRMETTDGQFVEMTPDSIQVGDANGSLLEMSDQRCLIHAATQLDIEAPGKRIFIRGQAIDFERA